MCSWRRRLTWLVCSLAALVLIVGCSKHRHREVRVHEEEQRGEVESVSPGEMVVE